MARTRQGGTCKLTGNLGPYVDSHLIPLALTKLSEVGAKYVETGIGQRVKHRSSSWYDGQLVTRDGEDILADIDSQGIEDLRRYRLVWTSWWPGLPLETDDYVFEGGKPAYRSIKIASPRRLQLFFLSLLWRAAASKRPEFADIAVGDDVLEDLRQRLVSRNPGKFDDYPVQLFQMITPGVPHNRTPLLERKRALNVDGSPGPLLQYARFYFDGLVAHIHLARGHELALEYLGTCLGFLERTIVFVHEYQSSRTAADMKEMVQAVWHEQMTPDFPKNAIVRAIDSAWPN